MNSHPSIAVVDDDTDLRETLGELLQEEGFSPRLFENGRAALEFLRDGGRPMLILLDLMMPEMNGWQFRAAQLEDVRLRSIPVVVMTASRGVEETDLDVDEILQKPIALGDLVAAIQRNLSATSC